MKSQSIDRQNWNAFAGQFSRSHNGWTASLEVREAGSPPHLEVDDRPFRGITVERHDGHDNLVFTFGTETDDRFAHVVRDPRCVVTAENMAGDGASLVVDSIDRGRCVLGLWKPEELCESRT
jgi:uncharacterized protein DUF5335